MSHQSMIPYEEAVAILSELGLARSLGVESLPLEQAVGRIVAERVVSQEYVPSFDNSAMDGFAVCSDWTRSASQANPCDLPVSDVIFAGDARGTAAEAGRSAVEIMTGAPMPVGPWDSVVKIEDVKVERDPSGKALSVRILAPVELEANVREKGEDFRPGQEVLPTGAEVTAETILAMASLGVRRVSVCKKPRVAILSTGKELCHYSTEALVPGMIRNSTGPFLEAALPFHGVETQYLGVIEDSPEAFEARIREIRGAGFDLILSTGAVSMGQLDFVGSSLEKLGARILFHKVAIRPGKPILCAEFAEGSGPVFLGLPGNPVSTAVGLRFFAGLYLRALYRLGPEKGMTAVLDHDSRKPDGLRCFFKGHAYQEPGKPELRVRALPGQASFMVSPFAEANCWLVFPPASAMMRAGSEVEIRPFKPRVGASFL